MLPAALDIARAQIALAGLRGTIELRLQSIAELTDEGVFDLAWLPQMFISCDALNAGVPGIPRVLSALRPGGWLILALAGKGDPDDRAHVSAYQSLLATTLGGGPVSVEQGRALLAQRPS